MLLRTQYTSEVSWPTLNFVSKDIFRVVHTLLPPSHTPTACHVFECSGSSQYVLATIGQAFELRYKLYLNSPRPQPMQIVDK